MEERANNGDWVREWLRALVEFPFIHPLKGSHPGVLLWHDSPGLRPVIRDLGKRIAAEGYSVLVPNLFYRAHRPPVFDASFDYANNPAIERSTRARWRRFS